MTKLRNPQKIFLIYFVLAALNLVVLGCSLGIHHQLISIFDNSVQKNQEWLDVAQEISEVESAIQLVNAPANNVFKTLDPNRARSDQMHAYRVFENLFRRFRLRIVALEDPKDPSLSKTLDEAHIDIVEMNRVAENVFQAFENKDTMAAGKYMAKVDEIYGRILQSVRTADFDLKKILAQDLIAQNEKNKSTALFEFILALFVIILVLGTAAYGWWLIYKINEYESIIEQERQRVVYGGKMSTLGEMASGIAHEINNPLAVIQMRSDQLKQLAERGPVNPDEIGQITERLDLTIQRIAKIIRGLISFARGNESEPRQFISLRQILEETLSLCHQRFVSQGVQISTHVDPENLQLFCRPVQIQQVLLNLLNNAVDAISELPEKWVLIEASIQRDQVEIVVEDSGLGISPDLREKIMVPFFTTKSVGRGTGLGLSISKGIIESHHGHLRLDSKSEHTRFVIELPVGDLGIAASVPLESIQ